MTARIQSVDQELPRGQSLVEGVHQLSHDQSNLQPITQHSRLLYPCVSSLVLCPNLTDATNPLLMVGQPGRVLLTVLQSWLYLQLKVHYDLAYQRLESYLEGWTGGQCLSFQQLTRSYQEVRALLKECISCLTTVGRLEPSRLYRLTPRTYHLSREAP